MYYYVRRHINFGIRANPNMTTEMCSKSIFMCHCETANIWTHLLTTLYFGWYLTLLTIRVYDFNNNQMTLSNNIFNELTCNEHLIL